MRGDIREAVGKGGGSEKEGRGREKSGELEKRRWREDGMWRGKGGEPRKKRGGWRS